MSESTTPSPPQMPSPLTMHSAATPDKPALIGETRTVTWKQLNDRCFAMAKKFYELGVRPGHKVALMTYNMPEFYEVMQALNLLRAGLVPVGYRMKPPEIEYIVENSDSKVLIFYTDFADRILPHKDNYSKLLTNGFISFGGSHDGALDYEDLFVDPPEVDLNNLPQEETGGESMIYTSGTTGKPKGAVRRMADMDLGAAARYMINTVQFLKYDANDVHLFCCPIYHSGPGYFAMVPFNLGGTIVFQERFDPIKWYELVAKHGVTSSHIVPTMVYSLLEVPVEFTDKLDLSSLRALVCGAAPLLPKAKLAALERFGPVFFEYYGSTETAVNTMISPEEIPARPTSVGKAFGENEIRIVDKDGKDVPDGERGLLYAHNAVCVSGYYKNKDATDEMLMGKFLTAGDIAIRDDEGYYYIVDRVKDMIIRGGVNVYPAEVESVIMEIPGIKEVAVVGKPDDHWGEIVAAFVHLEPGVEITEDEIKDYCIEKMASNKSPAIVKFTDGIPRSPTGKVLKRELRDELVA